MKIALFDRIGRFVVSAIALVAVDALRRQGKRADQKVVATGCGERLDVLRRDQKSCPSAASWRPI
jgi:hypothetical protein